MLFCLPIKRIRGQRPRKINPYDEPTVPISIHAKTTSKIAMLWTPEDNWDNDIVSVRMAKRLGAKIEQSEKDASAVEFMGQTLKTNGYVILDWGIERSRSIHKTRFLVATCDDPWFEVVLSRRHAIEYGLVQSRAHRNYGSPQMPSSSGIAREVPLRA